MTHIVYVVGPPAVGKSTVLAALERTAVKTFATTAVDNPHLAEAWTDKALAYRSQRWFIERHMRIMREASSFVRVFVEDDPLFSTTAHTEAMATRGLLDMEQVQRLARVARSTQRAVAAAGHTATVILLDAPTEVLAERMARRDGRFPGDVEWLTDIAERMRASRVDGQQAIMTDAGQPEALARCLLAHPNAALPLLGSSPAEQEDL